MKRVFKIFIATGKPIVQLEAPMRHATKIFTKEGVTNTQNKLFLKWFIYTRRAEQTGATQAFQ